MANRIKGLTVEIDGSTTGLDKALKNVNTTIKGTQTQLKDVQKLLKLDPSNTELLSQKQRLLKEAIGATKDKLDSLKTAQEQAKKQLEEGTLGQDKYDALQREIEETEQALKQLESQVSTTYAKLEKIDETGKKFKETGDKIAGVGKDLTMKVTAPIVGLGAAAVKTTADFDAQMSKVQAISGATGEEFDDLRAKAREMGAKTKFSASEAGEAFEYMAMAGWKTEDMLEGVEGIMNLAAASGEDLGTTSDIVTDALTAFGLSAKDSGHFADILAAASTNANTNVSMLGESFKYAAPVAGSLGISAEDTSVALGLMANAGIKASQAGTSLRTGLTNLAKPTKQMQTYMDRYNIALVENDDGSINLRETMISLREKMGGLSESEQAAAASAIFGKNSMAGWLSIINASDEDFDKLTGAIDNCDGSAESMAEIMQDNLSGQLTILKSQLEELAISFGDLLMPIIRKVVAAVQGFVDKLNSMSDSQREAIIKVLALAAAIGPLLLILGKMISTVGSAMSGFASLGKGIMALSTKMQGLGGISGVLGKAIGFLTSPIGLVIAAVAVLVAAFVHLWQTNEEFREKVTAIWNRVKEIFSGFVEGIKERLDALGIDFGKITETIKKIWDGFCSLLAPVFIAAFEIIANVLETILGVLTGLFDVFAGIFTGDWDMVWTGVKEIFSSIWNGIKGIFESVLNMIKGIANTVLGWFGTNWETVWTSVKSFFEGVWNGIKTFFTTVLTGIKTTFDSVWNGIKTVVTTVLAAIQLAITTVWNAIKLTAETVWNGIKTFFTTTLTAIKTTFSTVWEAIKTAVTTVWNTINTTATTVWNGIKTFFTTTLTAIQTTFSTVWNAIKTAVTTVWNGIKTTASTVWNGIKTFFSTTLTSIKSTFSTAWEGIKTTVSNIGTSIKTNVTTTWNNLKTSLSTTMTNIKSAASTAWEGMKTSIGTIVDGIKTKVSGVFDGIKSTASTVWGNIKTAMTSPVETAKTTISNAIERIKGLFNFTWSFPSLKMPHFSWYWQDIGGIVSIPMISVSWYKKAMDGGMILNNPTIFGMQNGQLLGAGEAGSETVVGTRSLMDMIRQAVSSVEQAMNIYYGGVTILPYWAGTDEAEQAILVTLPEQVIYSDYVDDYVYRMVVPVDFSSAFQEQPTEEQLRSRAQAYVRANAADGIPASIDVSFVALWQTEEYKNWAPLQKLKLCDTVTVYHKGLGIENKAKIVSVTYDVILERYEKMTIGEVKTNLGDSIRQISEEIKKEVPTNASVSQAISLATNILSGSMGGNIMINTNAQGQPVEILAMDTADITTAHKIIKINNNGISVSSAGYSGAFTVLLDMDGKLDAAALKGIIDSAMIKSGTLSDKQSNVTWNMATGAFAGKNVTITNLTVTKIEASSVSGETVSSGDGYTGSCHVDGATLSFRAGIVTGKTDDAPEEPVQTFTGAYHADGATVTVTNGIITAVTPDPEEETPGGEEGENS